MCVPLAAIRGRTSLQAADRGDLLVLKRRLLAEVSASQHRALFGTHYHFIFTCNKTISERQFKSRLKTHLFNLANK